MKNRITAFLLSIVLCLSLVGTAFAAAPSGISVRFTPNQDAQTVTMEIDGLTAGRTYRLCSLALQEAAAGSTEFELLRILDNFQADGAGKATVVVDRVRSTVFTEGNILRLNVVDTPTNWSEDYIIGQEEPATKAAVTIYDGFNRAVNPSAGDVMLVEFQVEQGARLTERELLDKLGAAMPSHPGYHRSGWLSGGSAVRFPMTVRADKVAIVMLWAKDSSTNPGGATSGGGGGGSGSTQSISVTKTNGGTVTCRPGSPSKGSTVTITVRPNDGYVLDSLTVTDRNGKTISITKVSDTEYTFIMPEGRVKVTPVFRSVAAPVTGVFRDVPATHTFYGDISWVASQGYMGGYEDGAFRPGANTTRQALWMVLARMDGANPATMTEARSWAVRHNVSDGSNPGGAMTRQQMVTMLYRYAQMKGYSTTGGIGLEQFSDASAVAGYAKDAMSWAVGNGIVQGNGNALNPNGAATRAHFAAFLHRFCTSVGIA